ncbi:hypothetical protein NL676_000842 [Syzygium grande]|nr:hypothetical protein NL676_000842 [Syzygium grande]
MKEIKTVLASVLYGQRKRKKKQRTRTLHNDAAHQLVPETTSHSAVSNASTSTTSATSSSDVHLPQPVSKEQLKQENPLGACALATTGALAEESPHGSPKALITDAATPRPPAQCKLVRGWDFVGQRNAHDSVHFKAAGAGGRGHPVIVEP